MQNTDTQAGRVAQARAHLAQARAAFAQNPNPGLSRSIAQLQRFIRRHSITEWEIECTDTFSGEANYCWVKRFRVRACSVRGAAIVAARHLGYSGRVRCAGSWGNGARYDVQGMAVCFFVQWCDVESPGFDQWPLINGKGAE